MALLYLSWEILMMEEKALMTARKVAKRMLRDAQNPFELPTQEFRDHFRLTKELVMEIVDAVKPQLSRQRAYGLTAECQVLTALLFYATGSFQRPTGANALVSVSQPSVSRIVRKVTLAVNCMLLTKWVRFPMTPAERAKAKMLFIEKRRPFLGAIGAVGCTHVLIRAPRIHEEAYVNHDGMHSLNVQVIVDPKLRILDVCARWPGARHDSFIWQQSSARAAMKYIYVHHGERDTFLLGDSGYRLEPWLLTPLPNYPENTRQYAYTANHCINRNPVERLFGVLRSLFRAVSGQRVLHYDPAITAEIFIAICVIHNMRIAAGMLNEDVVNEPFIGETGPTQHNVGEPFNGNQRRIQNLGEEVQHRVIHSQNRDLPCACDGPPNYGCSGQH